MKNKQSWQLLQEKEALQAKINKNDKQGGSDMKKALYHVKNMREEMEIHGIKPKNHILEQKEYIRKLEEKHKKQKEIKELSNEQELFKLKRFRNVESYVKQMRNGDYSYLDKASHQHRSHIERSVDRVQNNNQGHYNQNDENHNILNIKKPQNRNRSLSNQKHFNNEHDYSTVNEDDIEKHKNDMGNKNYSVQNLHQQQEQSSIQTRPDIPKDQRRLLTEEEKRAIIGELVEKRKNLFSQLNRMPIANITKAHQELKCQIEVEIDEVENAIKMFTSRKPVYVCDSNTFSH